MIKKTKKYWGALPVGYFEIARLGLESIKSKDNLGKLTWENGDESIEVFMQNDAALILTSIYSIKHGIELSIKALEVSINDQYTKGHDLDLLFTNLQPKFKDHCIIEHLNFFGALIKKYSKFDFDNNQLDDLNNEMFRYTEDQTGASIDYSKIHKIDELYIQSILDDIHDFVKILKILEEQYNLFYQLFKQGLQYNEIRRDLLKVPTISNPGFKNAFTYTD